MGKLTKPVKQMRQNGYKLRLNAWELQYLRLALPIDDIGAYMAVAEYFEMQAYFMRRIWKKLAVINPLMYTEAINVKFDLAHTSALRIWALNHRAADEVGNALKIRIILETGQIL